jgi:L-ribulokinase
MEKENFVIGVDYGTDSVRSLLIDAADGTEIASAVCFYPRWKDGLFCNPAEHQYRQHPLDYIEGLEQTIVSCLSQAGPAASRAVRAISVDTTGSTPVAVDETGTPLGLLPGFRDNPNALFVLWKDHTAVREAAEINTHAKRFDTNYLKYVGGIYSSEWFWAKLLHVLRVDEAVRKACHSWVEHCDWIPFLLTGGRKSADMRRSVCAAGHKALWAKDFGPTGFPPDEFFATLDPLLKGFTGRLFTRTCTADRPAGTLSPEWAARLGLSTAVTVGVGAFDAHMGAVGGQIEPYHLSKVMGTSTCDMLVAPPDEIGGRLVKGICGQVPGSVIPGMVGLEAGQSAFGDAYAWFRNLLAWPLRQLAPDRPELIESILPELSSRASRLQPSELDPLALDWLNGRRTPDANQLLKAAITGINLGTDAPRLFYTIAEATCFGARAIVERFHEEGVPIRGLIGLGGVARKSPFIMQMMADVMDRPIRIHASEQTCALGAAMFAATAAGLYSKVEEAMDSIGQGFDATYVPDPGRTQHYSRRYSQYRALGRFVESTTDKL